MGVSSNSVSTVGLACSDVMNTLPERVRSFAGQTSRGDVENVRNAPSPETPDHALTVLVVDPDPDARAIYRSELIAAGLRVFDATDGREALVRLYGQRPHAVVVNAMLPYIDGLQLCALLREDPATAGIRIVVVTSDGTPGRVARIRGRGADAVIVKPVPPDTLASAVCQSDPDGLLPQARDTRGAALADVPPAVRRIVKVRARERYVTQHPPARPPRLRCPACDLELQYDRSHVGGVSDRHPEQWDYFVCATHGAFQYRQRTRRLRAV
jgi:CheY-like chemotaxis protein